MVNKIYWSNNMLEGIYDVDQKGIELHIPESVIQAISLPENRIKQELLTGLTISPKFCKQYLATEIKTLYL